MRDRSPFRDEPGNWSDAFNRLPMESPERDAWSRLALELGPPANPRKHLVRWAMAAAVATLAITLPLAWLARDVRPGTPVVATKAPAHAVENKVKPESFDVPPVQAVDASPATSASALPPKGQLPAHTQVTARESDPHPPRRQIAAIAHEDTDALFRPIPPSDAPSSGLDALPGLYAESAQLEALLVQLRDERVATGAASALTSQYESRVALIDASLSDPALQQPERIGLWQQRVDTLQQLVSFETTQRWLATQGERYDGQIVAVY